MSRFLCRIAICKREYMKHRDKLRICEDRDISLWVRRKRQAVIDICRPRTKAATTDEGMITAQHKSPRGSAYKSTQQV